MLDSHSHHSNTISGSHCSKIKQKRDFCHRINFISHINLTDTDWSHKAIFDSYEQVEKTNNNKRLYSFVIVL